MNTYGTTRGQVTIKIVTGLLLMGIMLPTAQGQFSITYYDNYNNVTHCWDNWEGLYGTNPPPFWNDEYLANFTSGHTEQSALITGPR